jgi:FkbM family methyltransferase
VRISESLNWYLRLGGIRAVCATAMFRLLGQPRLLRTTPPDSNSPVYLRIDTSDFCAYYDVLIAKTRQYDLKGITFNPATIVDAGAHIGMVSILFARRYPLSKIIAIEPEPSNFALLLRNTSSYKNILPICAAVWTEDGEVTLGSSNIHPKGAFRIVENGQTRVRAVTIDTLMRETGIQSIDILKMDIEGSEREVFSSCNWIDSVQFIAIELHDRVKAGCRCAVETAARDFRSVERGAVTFFIRQHRPSTTSTRDVSARPEVHGSRR